MPTISREDLEQLIERGKSGANVLSVYLDVDQSRGTNLNRRYEAALKDRLRALEQKACGEDDLRKLQSDAQRVLEFVSAAEPRGRGLVLFSDVSHGFFWNRELFIPVRHDARWEETPYIRPLAEALDEYERYIVALVNKQKLRLFSVHLGEVEEHQVVEADEKIKRTKVAAKDARVSAEKLQHREDDHIYRHLKDYAAKTAGFLNGNPSERLIIAGPREVATEFRDLLPSKLQPSVVKIISLPENAGPREVLAATVSLQEETERASEMKVVEDLITLAGKKFQAALHLPETLEALHEGRIRKLVYVDGLTLRGARCTKCDSLLASAPDSCPYCGGEVRAVEDLVERVTQRVLDSGGQSENVRGQAADRLREAGGIGAMLRF